LFDPELCNFCSCFHKELQYCNVISRSCTCEHGTVYLWVRRRLSRALFWVVIEYLPTFRRNMSPPYQGRRRVMAYSFTQKMEATCHAETSVDLQWTTRRYIPEDRILLFLCLNTGHGPLHLTVRSEFWLRWPWRLLSSGTWCRTVRQIVTNISGDFCAEYPENRGNMFLRNVGNYQAHHTASRPRRLYAS
jgi:hypothetical protein